MKQLKQKKYYMGYYHGLLSQVPSTVNSMKCLLNTFHHCSLIATYYLLSVYTLLPPCNIIGQFTGHNRLITWRSALKDVWIRKYGEPHAISNLRRQSSMFFFSCVGNTDPVTKAPRSQQYVKTCPITLPHWSDFMSDFKILFRLRWFRF